MIIHSDVSLPEGQRVTTIEKTGMITIVSWDNIEKNWDDIHHDGYLTWPIVLGYYDNSIVIECYRFIVSPRGYLWYCQLCN